MYKIIDVFHLLKDRIQFLMLVAFIFSFSACATYELQVNEAVAKGFPIEKTLEHSFFLIGDAGLAAESGRDWAVVALKEQLKKAQSNSTVIYLGDNIYPKGLPKKDDESRAFAEAQLDAQIEAVNGFKGNTIFIPGNHDWYSDGLNGLERQEKYVEQRLGKDSFLPEDGCPIEKIDISDDIVLIILDSEWYLTNWDKHPKMNDKCDIKTREKFFVEFEDDIKKARGKTTIVAIHHPIFTNGPHGGQYSFKSHLSPIPVLGSLKNLIRKTGGVVTVDVQNKFYNEFRERIVAISQENEKTIFVSGHEHTLQYLIQDNLPQIVSGSGSKTSATRNVGPGLFSYGEIGFARLDVFTDGSSHVRFYAKGHNSPVFETTVHKADTEYVLPVFEEMPTTRKASIYSKEEITKGGLYRFFWGERYRKYFGTEIEAPTVRLDTLLGGLKPVRKGGGHQSKSLRLEDKMGRQYVMRALRKNALRYLQSVAFKNQYIEGQFEDTYTQDLLLDVFTGSHPYAPFTVATLADAVGIYHTKPVLYYVPKQKALGAYNEDFGDELYMIEEHTSEGHGDKANFGYSNEIISTDDVLEKLLEDEEFVLDEASYIRARLFDMVIGDWDRHEDQWRWVEFKEDDRVVYRPVPRDRDQVFSIMSDGALLGVLTTIVPSLRLLQSYDEELKSTKWFNLEPYALDMALINNSGKPVWDQQVKVIQNGLTDEIIEEAFSFFPAEVMDSTIVEIKKKLIGRIQRLQDLSDRYYEQLNRIAVVKGTHKDDWFDVVRLPDGKTKVASYRIKGGEKADVMHERVYDKAITKEIWIYGLDDDDIFEVSGNGKSPIKLRLIGGQNKDVYGVKNGKKVKIYDYKSKESEFLTQHGTKKLTDDYDTNVYNYKKLKYNSNQFYPKIGANPDDGLALGFTNIYTRYGFERNPFSAQHKISAGYYFATQGFDFEYNGEIANVLGKLNLGLNAKFTSPNYATNFFGIGNETNNPQAEENDGLDVGRDYNRVKLEQTSFTPSLVWRGRMGAMFQFSLSYESFEVEPTEGRFINTVIGDNVSFSDEFYGADVIYSYANFDNTSFPTLGMSFGMHVGYRHNVSTSDGFGYINPELAIDYKLIPSGQLVLASKVKGQINIGDDFQFYQGANLGQNEGLRGFRRERFIGNSAFAQTTDLRLNLRKVKTALLPLNIGFFGGFDYGRVWADGEDSSIWHTSVGGGIFAEAAEMLSFNLSAFNSTDGVLFAFRLGFGF